MRCVSGSVCVHVGEKVGSGVGVGGVDVGVWVGVGSGWGGGGCVGVGGGGWEGGVREVVVGSGVDSIMMMCGVGIIMMMMRYHEEPLIACRQQCPWALDERVRAKRQKVVLNKRSVDVARGRSTYEHL